MIGEKRERETATEKETGRLESFSDGVFAVAITLLVFDLMKVPLPLSGHTFSSKELTDALLSQWTSYVTFFISFATILIMWINHHGMFKLVHKSDTLFMFANGFLLLLVTVVPFPTALVSEYLTKPAAEAACVVYSGLFVIICIAYNLLWWSAAYHHRLLKSNVASSQVKRLTRNLLLGLPSYLLALISAFWFPFVSIGICAVLWIFWGFNSYEKRPMRKPHENIQGAES